MDQRKPFLPDELWLDIASHLPDAVLAKLSGLNSVFLSLGLDAKYRYVALFGSGKKPWAETVKYLEHLLQPYIRKRIVAFEVNSRHTSAYDLTPQLCMEGGAGLANALSSILGGSLSPDVQAIQKIHQLSHQLISNLPVLRSLVICDAGLNSPLCFSLASSLWKLQTQKAETMTLRHLLVAFIPEYLDRLIPLSPSSHGAIRCLKSLHLRMLDYGPNHPPAGLASSLAALHTFRSLIDFIGLPAPGRSLFAPNGGEVISAGVKQLCLEFMASRSQQRFFDALLYSLSDEGRSLPNLTHFSLTTAPGIVSHYRTAVGFLDAYKDQITHLRISTHNVMPRNYGNVVGPPLLGFAPPTLSALLSLEISGLRIDPFLAIKTVQSYILQSTERLTSLIINDGFPLRLSHLKQLLLVFPSRRDPPPTSYHNVVLRTLRLNVLILTPRHLDLLFDHLPHLRELDLRISVSDFPFRSHENHEPFVGRALDIRDRFTLEEKERWQEQFWAVLQVRIFEGWRLEVIRMRANGVGKPVVERMRHMLHAMIPSLVFADVE